jgi:hypothetical protein
VVGEKRVKSFISYRHGDTQGTAWALYGALRTRFGSDDVFFDNGTLRPGDQWLTEIEANLAEADVFLALIGKQWMTSLVDHTRRGTKDFVATEIDLAFRSSPLRIIPVLVDDADPPDADQLPLNLKQLPACHMQRLSPTDLLEDIEALIKEIENPRHSQCEPEPPARSVSDSARPEISAEADARTSEPPHLILPAPDDDHYQTVIEEGGNMVVFLGAGVNADDELPDDSVLRSYLAKQSKLALESSDLAEMAQRVGTLKGEPRMFKWISHVLAPPVKPPPAPVHRYLARLPGRLAELGLEKRYPMIVTTKYDAALERAFIEAHEPFDVAIYMGPRTREEHRGRFVHIPWGGQPQTINEPNRYDKFPITYDGELQHTVIVRIHGAVHDLDAGFSWKDNFVITEDHYIDFLSGHIASDLIPVQLLAKLNESNCLFLGYTIADWRLRVFLKRIWRGEKLGRALYWAVEPNPDALERKLWQDVGVKLFSCRLTDYVEGLDRYLCEHRAELAV